MIEDFYRTLLHRQVNKTSDGGGGFTESLVDSEFQGAIFELNGSEMMRNQQLGNNATSQLHTEEDLALTERVVDGARVYEVVWAFTDFHKRYLLKQVS